MRFFGFLLKLSTNTFELYHKTQKNTFINRTIQKYESLFEEIDGRDGFTALSPVKKIFKQYNFLYNNFLV
jgi:hypothetical protein